ncbi:hypothetical protein QC762_507350 [Podospora pseudocomata]|uniref:4-hydroxy-2-oxoglutarate aldolase, mitochondrial n=1 Tax=Podospora pseudocomata TaxID=2093779 RepID=A0ABR0GCN1_9PEZI|nr:hypothetical protein QC762_507350 [Podospora pseudocomata]
MSTRIPPKGVYVPSPTFFLPRDSSSSSSPESTHGQLPVDISSQTSHSIFLARSGITGLVLLGSTGEAIHLSRTERASLVSGVRKGLDEAGYPNYPIMAGVLTNGIDETLQWLDDYASAGADWGLVLVPGYFGAAATTQEGIVEYFREVAKRSRIPVLVYNYPGVTNGVVVQPETYTKLAGLENVVGVKMSHGNVSIHLQVGLDLGIDHEGFRVYSGFGQQLGPVVLFGGAGVIDGLAGFYPRTVVRLMGLVEGGELAGERRKEVQRLQYVVSKAEEFIVRYGIFGIKEAVFRVTGLGSLEKGRPPLLGGLAEGEWERGRKLFLEDIERVEQELKGT